MNQLAKFYRNPHPCGVREYLHRKWYFYLLNHATHFSLITFCLLYSLNHSQVFDNHLWILNAVPISHLSLLTAFNGNSKLCNRQALIINHGRTIFELFITPLGFRWKFLLGLANMPECILVKPLLCRKFRFGHLFRLYI